MTERAMATMTALSKGNDSLGLNTENKRSMRILVTGGGTGGHVTPALAVIQTIKELGINGDFNPVFLYVGSVHGIERDLAKDAGIDFVGVQTGKLRRSSSRLGHFSRQNLVDLARVPVGITQSFRAVRRFRPHVVLSTGGYVSVPTVMAAGMLRVPILIHEQTVQIGLANRIAAGFATRIALSFEDARKELPGRFQSKAFTTGNPVRNVIFSGRKDSAVNRFGFEPVDSALPTLYVTGGAQGSQIINRAVGDVLPELLAVCKIIHQCGKQRDGTPQDYDELTKIFDKLPDQLRHRYFLTRFVGEEIGDVYALADVVVGRSGAGTVTEVAAVGKPAIFVPLVPTGGDEQTRNAQRSVDAGAATIIPQRELDGQRLLSEIRTLLDNPKLLERMSVAALSLATPNAAHDLARAVLELGLR